MYIDSVNLMNNMDNVNMSRATKYHHGNLRKELIRSALELLDEGGIESVGIRQVARKAGVAHSAPANHFRNKRALFTVLATEIFQDLLIAIQTYAVANKGKERHFEPSERQY